MPIENPDHWFLKKHENGEVFGPVHFNKIRDWARSAHVNSQDAVSADKTVWTKAPMIPELEMDWLVVVEDDLLYGPTTLGALLEFARLGEITSEAKLINCCTATTVTLGETTFFQEAQKEPEEEELPVKSLLSRLQSPAKGDIRHNLQQRVRDLESSLLDKRRRLLSAEETIAKMEVRIKELEDRIRDFSGLKTR
jgi:hypothetical protein